MDPLCQVQAWSSPAMGWVSFLVLGLPLESFSDRLHSRFKLFFDLRMNPDADTQDLAGIYQLEAAVFVQNADYTFAMMSAVKRNIICKCRLVSQN